MDWTPAHDWLLAEGFVAENFNSEQYPKYTGTIQTQFGSVEIHLRLDKNGISYPTVQLVRRPGWLPEKCAHLNHNLFLCCTDKSTSAPDRRDPRAIVENVVVRARNLIADLVISGGHAADEFVKLWGGEHELSWGYLEKQADADDGWQTIDALHSSWNCIVPQSKLAVVEDWLGVTTHESCLSPIHIPVEQELLAKGPGWPITCVRDLDDWLGYIDANAQEIFRSALQALTIRMARSGTSSKRLFVLLHHGNNDLGILFDIQALIQWLPKGIRWNPNAGARQLFQALTRKLVGNPGFRRFVNVDSQRMLNRAMGDSSMSLVGKRIILVGAGSVGSHLGMALARSGAGSDGGTLVIYDADEVSVENIARAAYDTRHIGMGKADALASMLRGTLVGIDISAHNTTAPTSPEELQADLILDASGDHAFSTWLSSQLVIGNVPPLLFCWVSGQGAAVVTYLQLSSADSCLSCLGPADVGSVWNPLISEDEAKSHQTGPCGESFMPYSVGAPMLAAGLAITHALDWVRGDVSSPMRSIVLAPTRAKMVPAEPPVVCQCSRP